MAFSPNLRYLIDYAEYPKDLWTELDRTFGKHNEDIYRNLGRKFITTRFLYSKFLASTLSDKAVQDEEEADSSTQSIWIEDSLLWVTPSPVALKVYEISDISSPHITYLEEEIRISVFEENISFHSMQKISNGSSIINFVHSLLVIAPGKGGEFDFSISNDIVGVQISNYLDILEIISDCRSDPFTLIDL